MNNDLQDHERRLEQFEGQWRNDGYADIASYVLSPDSRFTLSLSEIAEFVETDCEYRWRRFRDQGTSQETKSVEGNAQALPAFPVLSDYVKLLSALNNDDGILARLILGEYQVRQRWGDKPDLEAFLADVRSTYSVAVHAAVADELRTDGTIVPDASSGNASRIPVQIDAYQIVEEIASGGMGAVFLANQEQPVRRQVALKVIKSGADSKEIITRFEAERQALAMMSHPNIAQIYDGGTTQEGSPYFVMEYVAGIPMAEYCDSHKLTIRQRLELFIPVCHAIQHAHQKGIIHRDLKPSNVLIAEHDGKPIPKVIDFGLAKALEQEAKLTDETMMTEYGAIVGTIHYMSPEQAGMDFLDIDTRTDIYSLGVMLYELLTGSTPLDRATLKQQALLKVLEIIREKDPPKPSDRLKESSDTISAVSESREISPIKLRSILSGELDWVVMKALEKERERRYSSANDFAIDVERFLNHQTVSARPPSVVYRARKFAQRNRGMLAAAIAMLLTVVIAGWLTVRMRTEAAIAKVEKQLSEELTDLDLSADEWHQITGLVADIRQRDILRGDSASQRTTNAMLDAIATATRRPRMSRSDRDQLGEAIARVSPAVSESVDQQARLEELRLVVERLEGNWSFAFGAGPESPAAFKELFAATDLKADSDGLLHPQKYRAEAFDARAASEDARVADAAPLTRLRHKCTGDLRVEAVFEEWELCHEVGLTLYEVDELGYDFVVTLGQSRKTWNEYTRSEVNRGPNEQNSFSVVRSEDATVLIEIRRGDESLLRHSVSTKQLPEGPLRVTATRQGNVFSIRVNDLPERSVLDPFPFRDRDEGFVGLRGTINAGLKSIRADELTIDADASPLSSGDRFYRRKDYSAALDAYQEQITLADANIDVQLEAKFKFAICQLKLGRSDEAKIQLSQVQQAEHSTWSALALITLWDEALKAKRFDDANSAYTLLKTMGVLERAALLTTEETRQRIVDSVLRPLSMKAVLETDDTLLPRVRQAAEIDRLLSYDGLGSFQGQFRFSKALRLQGESDEACEVLRKLTERTDSLIILNNYLRELRVAGRADEALVIIDDRLKNTDNREVPLYRARVRTNVALGDFETAEADVSRGLQTPDANTYYREYVTDLIMMRGFLKHRRGDVEGALADWRMAFRNGNSVFDYAEDSNHTGLVLSLMLGGLTDELTIEQTQKFTQLALKGAGFPELSAMVSGVVSPQRIHTTLSQMWKSPKGLEWAEAFAFENVSLRYRISKPVVLTIHEYLAAGAFPDGASIADRDQCWLGAEEAFEAIFVKKSLSLPQCVQLAMAWKGAGLFGTTSLPDTLPDVPRARLAYLFGHHFLAKNDATTAEKYFRQSVEIDRADDAIRSAAERSLKLIEAKQGLIDLRWEGVKPLDVSIRNQQGKEVKRQQLIDNAEVYLSAGNYDVHIGDSDTKERSVKVRRGKTSIVKFAWEWEPDNQEAAIPGLLSHPAKLADGSSWQIVRTFGASKFTDLAWNPNGEEVAMATGDNVIRIANATSYKIVRVFSHHPARVQSVDWSPDGKTIAVGDVTGQIYFLDAESGSKIGKIFRSGSEIQILRWNPNGQQVVAGTARNGVHIIAGDGTLVATLEGHSSWVQQVGWNLDGSQLATASPKKVILWDLKELKPRQEIPGYRAAAWRNSDGSIAVANQSEIAMFDSTGTNVIAKVTIPDRGAVRDLTWAPGEASLLVSGNSGGFYEWKLSKKGDAEPAFRFWDFWTTFRIRFSANGKRVASGAGGGVHFGNSEYETLGWSTTKNAILTKSVSVSPGSTMAAVVSEAWEGEHNRHQVVDFRRGRTVTARKDEIHFVTACHPVHNIVVTVVAGGDLQAIDTDGKLLARRKLGDGVVKQMQWGGKTQDVYLRFAEGRIVKCPFAVVADNQKLVSSVTLGEPQTVAEVDHKITRMCISPDEKLLATIDYSKLIQLRSTTDGSVVRELQSLSVDPRAVTFSPDGRYLAVSIWDHVQIWDSTNSWSRKLHKTSGRPPAALVWLNNHEIATGSGDLQILDITEGDFRFVRQFNEPQKSLQLIDEDRLVVCSRHSVMQEVDLKTGRIKSLAVATWDGKIAQFTAGGALLSGLETLTGLSCIINTPEGQKSMPAAEFFERYGFE